MSVVEYRNLLFEVSEELCWVERGRILFICRIFLPDGCENDIKDALSLLIKLEEGNHLGIDYLDVLKDLLKMRAKWNTLQIVENFEIKRRKYKVLLKHVSRVLDECNQLERLISICEGNLPHGREIRKADIKDAYTLFTKLEECNSLGFGRLDIVKTIAIEMEKPDLLKLVEEFEKKREEEEHAEREKNKLEESMKRMFKDSSLFGSSAHKGTGLFGSGQQNSSVFGQNTTTTAPAGSGLFGSSANEGTAGLFGSSHQNSSQFEQKTTTATPDSGLFGSSAHKGTGLFGSGQQNSSLFGQNTTTTAPGSGLFGSSANEGTAGLFGSSHQNSPLFEQKTTTTAPGILGSSGDTGLLTDKGTSVKFSAVQGTDLIVKNGMTTNISVRHQCITVMSNYDKKSIEELRIEDYEAGRKPRASGSAGSSGFSTSTSTGEGLSASSSTSTGLFGQQQSTGVFGQTGTGLFGTQTSSTTLTGFGSGFGATTSTGPFGQTTSEQTITPRPRARCQRRTRPRTRVGVLPAPEKDKQSTAFGAKPFETGLGSDTQTGFSFGSNTGGPGTSALNIATSTPGSLFGAKPTVFGTGAAFGGVTGGTGLLGTTGTLGTGTGLNTGTLGTDRAVAVLTTARYGGERLRGVVTPYCTFCNAAGDTVEVTTLMILQKSSSLKEFVNSFTEAVLPTANSLRAISEGPLCFTIQAEDTPALAALWERYHDGTLQRNLQEFLVTEEIKQLEDGDVTVTVQIDEQEYRNALLDLMKLQRKETKVEEEKGRLKGRASSDSDLYCRSRTKETVLESREEV